MALSIDIAANTRQAQSQVKDLSKELDKVSDSLDDVAKDSKDAANDMERSFRDMVQDAKKVEKGVGDIDGGFKKASAGMDDFKSEANQTAKESAASFDGSAESIGDAFQEVAANAFAGFGPAGAVAGIAAAAGIGVVIKAFEDIGLAQEANEQEIADWADAYIEAGSNVLSASQIIAGAQDIITDPEKWRAAQDNAKLWGVTVETAVLAAAGNEPSLRAVERALEGQRDAFVEATDAGRLNYEQRDKELGRLAEATGAYGKLSDGIAQGKTRADIFSQSLVNVATTTEGATTKVDEFGDSVVTLPDGKQIYIDAETGQATQDTDAIEQKVYGIKDKNVNINVGVVDDTARQMEDIINNLSGRRVTVGVGTVLKDWQ